MCQYADRSLYNVQPAVTGVFKSEKKVSCCCMFMEIMKFLYVVTDYNDFLVIGIEFPGKLLH